MTKKPERNIWVYIKQLKRPIFTTHELISLSGKSASAVTQALNYLVKQGLLIKVYRGVWIEADQKISPYSLAPFLKPKDRVYVSFLSALHLHGIVEQIPQVMTLASTAHSATLRTGLGVFHLHRIAPEFFAGFDWYRGEGNFLIAEPEKALVDCLYLSAHKKRQYAFFPELTWGALSVTGINGWVNRIPSPRIRLVVKKKLEGIKQQYKGGHCTKDVNSQQSTVMRID
jgi:predicted transcriptional regulator of viral defense system